MPKELTPESAPEEKLSFLKAAADSFNADLTQIVCRHKNGKLMSVSAHARGAYAVALLRFLESKKMKRVD